MTAMVNDDDEILTIVKLVNVVMTMMVVRLVIVLMTMMVLIVLKLVIVEITGIVAKMDGFESCNEL